MGVSLHGLGLSKVFLDVILKAQVTKEKTDKFHQNLKLLCFKEHYQESDKTTQRMGEIICKSYIG